jgi:hypothetical protein
MQCSKLRRYRSPISANKNDFGSDIPSTLAVLKLTSGWILDGGPAQFGAPPHAPHGD